MPDKTHFRPPINQRTAIMQAYESPFITIRVGQARWLSRARYDSTMLVAIHSDHSEQPEFRQVGKNRKPYPYYYEIITNGGESLGSGVTEGVNEAILEAGSICANIAASQPEGERIARKPLEKYVGLELKGVDRIIACCTTNDDLLDLAADTLHPTEYGALYYTWVRGMTQAESSSAIGVSAHRGNRAHSSAKRKISENLQAPMLLHAILDALAKRKHPSVLRRLNNRNLNLLLRHGITNYLMLLKRTNAAISRETGVSAVVIGKAAAEVKELEGIYG